MGKARMATKLISCLAGVVILILGGCASTSNLDDAAAGPDVRERSVRCPAGHMMVCDAKKVGRIRFGRMGNENLESCSCERDNYGAGRTQQPALPQ